MMRGAPGAVMQIHRTITAASYIPGKMPVRQSQVALFPKPLREIHP
jgi:hypothetical protein